MDVLALAPDSDAPRLVARKFAAEVLDPAIPEWKLHHLPSGATGNEPLPVIEQAVTTARQSGCIAWPHLGLCFPYCLWWADSVSENRMNYGSQYQSSRFRG